MGCENPSTNIIGITEELSECVRNALLSDSDEDDDKMNEEPRRENIAEVKVTKGKRGRKPKSSTDNSPTKVIWKANYEPENEAKNTGRKNLVGEQEEIQPDKLENESIREEPKRTGRNSK